jgi:sugar lactone lactonase YvrE
VAVNRAGDLFIADTFNNVVREVTPNGKISTFAGDGTAGYAGDGRPARRAELTAPTGVTVDALGNVYIADAGNNVIRRVSRSGVITTVAGDYAADAANDGRGGFSGDGGPATSAQLDSPQGVAVNRAGDLFIADTFNNAIREVTPKGIITTIVDTSGTETARGSAADGNGGPAATATLNSPYAVAVDNSTGDVYIADTADNQIRVVTGLAVPLAVAGGPVAPRTTPGS